MIGPEGGFEPEEVEMAVASGFKLVSMGPRICGPKRPRWLQGRWYNSFLET
jgi:hypothetical protein